MKFNTAPTPRLLEILSERRQYPAPSMVRAKDYARLEAEVRSALIVREVKARLKADAIRMREARRMYAKAKGLI